MPDRALKLLLRYLLKSIIVGVRKYMRAGVLVWPIGLDLPKRGMDLRKASLLILAYLLLWGRFDLRMVEKNWLKGAFRWCGRCVVLRLANPQDQHAYLVYQKAPMHTASRLFL